MENKSVPAKYKAVLTYDYARTPRDEDEKKWTEENNAYEALKCALVQLEWTWTETSAFVIETCDLNKVWRGAGLVARQGNCPGVLSALTLVLQGGGPKVPSSMANHKSALTDIGGKPLPF